MATFCLKAGSTSQAASASCSLAVRTFATTASSSARRAPRAKSDDPLALRLMQKFQHDDVPTLGHEMIQRKRDALKMFRTIEFEIPKLAAFRQEYKPPAKDEILQFRFQHYQGEENGATRKVTMTVDVRQLFSSGLLKTPEAKHKFLLIAGPRFHAQSPEAVAASTLETIDSIRGNVLISCEKMPADRQNLKWCSDTFDTMIAEANKPSPEFQTLPIDTRHTIARENKKLQFLRRNKPTFGDFPKHWL